MYQKTILSLLMLPVIAACRVDNISDENLSAVENHVVNTLVSAPVSHGNEAKIAQTRVEHSPETSNVAVATQHGRLAFIDPSTGKLTSKPSGDQLRQIEAMQKLQSQKQQSTFQNLSVQKPLKSGGFKATLPQRFHSQLNATVNETGRVKVQHQKVMPSADIKNQQAK